MELATALEFAKSRREGILTTLRVDGRAQLSNIFYRLGDDGLFRISVTDTRAKTRNLRRDPRAALHVGGDNFWAYVVLDATAERSAVAAHVDDAVVDEVVEMYRCGPPSVISCQYCRATRSAPNDTSTTRSKPRRRSMPTTRV